MIKNKIVKKRKKFKDWEEEEIYAIINRLH